MTCVPRKLRSFAASFATMMYHLFGYFAGPTVIGGVADAYDGVQWGMRVCMSASGFGVVLFGLAWHFSVRQLKETRYLHGTKNMPQSDKKIVSMSNDKFDALSVTSDSTDTPHADDEISKQMMARSPSSPTLARHRNEKKFLDINVISAKNI
ncbi:hypothetical protein SARC_12705 [Sphaeroforma arctica JP610]|uniref:Uncharacterized protein n=1 Tax=Sphaeroforma arctica JP610 TaxID=667725 RepID=A0A0L0FE60_9EUKA|nr:hypothetical protein SARC_12705 [Sphaeroforma arctica JP610]KNC74756.1 hypothetical protein SARC_12705 [Sphaeroforma arctica JP610]|eukprot:XP_014148658.1 hypothetical protein SARC_12705 [Sphaeroforma arctica JP610]